MVLRTHDAEQRTLFWEPYWAQILLIFKLPQNGPWSWNRDNILHQYQSKMTVMRCFIICHKYVLLQQKKKKEDLILPWFSLFLSLCIYLFQLFVEICLCYLFDYLNCFCLDYLEILGCSWLVKPFKIWINNLKFWWLPFNHS